MKKRKGLNIRRKIIVFSALLLIVPICLIGSSSYKVAKQETDLLIEASLKNTVHLISESINQFDQLVSSGDISKEEAQEEIKKMILGPLDGEGKRTINKKINLGDNGYAFIIDRKANVLGHPSIEGQNLWDSHTADGYYYVQDMIHIGLNGGGFTYYDWPLPGSTKEATKITYTMYVADWDWIVAAGSYLQDFNQGQAKINKAIMITTAISIVVGIFLSVVFSNYLVNPIRKIANVTKKVANGDLTSEEIIVRNGDELGELAANFNVMQRNLKQLVEQLSLHSNGVLHAATTLQQSTQEASEATKQIGHSIEKIATGIEKQAKHTEQSKFAMEDMVKGIQLVTETSGTAFEVSSQSEQEASEGHQLMHSSLENMNAIYRTVYDISSIMTTLNENSEQIGEVITVISDVAEQTRLLALNASIEAAHAGEHGRGFSVVAENVRRLADTTMESTNNIRGLIASVQHKIKGISDLTIEGIGEVNKGLDTSNISDQKFTSILESIRSVVKDVQESSTATEQMSASAEQIYSSLTELNAIAELSSTNSLEISSASEEQIAVLEEVHASSVELQKMSEQLQELVSKFKL